MAACDPNDPCEKRGSGRGKYQKEQPTKFLGVSPDMAMIIDLAYKGNLSYEAHRILGQLVEIISQDKTLPIEVTEDDLWELRAIIMPNLGMGKTTGYDVLVSIYKKLWEFENEQMFEQLGLPKREAKKEEKLYVPINKSDDSSANQDTSPDDNTDAAS